jgi:hypothetical protein
VRTVLNVLWHVLAGVWLALGYVLASVLMGITIIGIVDHEETRPLDAHRFYGRLIAGARPIRG